MGGAFGDYVVYVDEAGDHGSISKEFPVFVLAFCIFQKREYAERVLPAVHSLKFSYFGHDAVDLQEREIRKATDEFVILRDGTTRERFMGELGTIIREAPFTLIAAIVDKREPQAQPARNPYTLALDEGLVHVTKFLRSRSEARRTHVVVESRGKNEDRELREAFDAYREPSGTLAGCNLDLVFASKAHNHSGMQLADQVARPIGRHVINPEQPNRAYDILRTKFWEGPDEGAGHGMIRLPRRWAGADNAAVQLRSGTPPPRAPRGLQEP